MRVNTAAKSSFILAIVLLCAQMAGAQASAPSAVAKAMVAASESFKPVNDALLLTGRLLGTLASDTEREQIRNSASVAVASILATTAEAPQPKDRVSIDMRYVTWLIAYDRLAPKVTRSSLEQYEKRASALTPDALKEWIGASERAGVSHRTNTDAAISVVFFDALWTQAAFRSGQPRTGAERLKATPESAVADWAEALRATSNGKYCDCNVKMFAAYALVSVDGLFQKGVFQNQLFVAALPIAKQIIQSAQ